MQESRPTGKPTKLEIVILAAGQGTRMRSNFPKVLHQVANKSLLEHVYDTAKMLNPEAIHVVVGHNGNDVRKKLNLPVSWVEQAQQLGTGHAVLQALPFLNKDARVLILPGDVPCLSVETLTHLLQHTPENAIGILTALVPNPQGLGRIIRDHAQNFVEIIEEKDATDTQRQINEVNTAVVVVPVNLLQKYLPKLANHNAQEEYYLTDVPTFALADKHAVLAIRCHDAEEVQGVNDRWQLSLVERYYQHKQAKELMKNGTTIRDPLRFDLRGELQVGQDVEFDINVLLEGNIRIGDHCHIGANVILRNVTLGNYVSVKDNSVLEDAMVGDHCQIGPFARLRPGAKLAESVHIGNFVEVKKSFIDDGSKANHLAYIGDATIGKNVNVGAGTITCNYDGVNKHTTIIEDEAFIGSNTSLVAPVVIGQQATIGAGSIITKNAPEKALTLGRAKQVTISNWQRPVKKED